MKRLLAIIGVAALLATANAQTNTNSTPILSGPALDLWRAATTGTNWLVAPYVIKSSKSGFGGGIAGIYNFNDFVATSIRLDWLDHQFWMPSGSLQLQALVKVFGRFTAIPFAFSGIAIPIGGAEKDNGTVAGIVGIGMAARLPESWKKHWYIPNDVVYDYEYWTIQTGAQQRFGLLWKF